MTKVKDNFLNHIDKLERWNKSKIDLQKKILNRKNRPNFEEREIWWRDLGMNIGTETYGKDEQNNGHFQRPVLIIKRFSSYNFLAIPLTTKIEKEGPYYFHFSYLYENIDKKVVALLSQARSLDAMRLVCERIAKIPENKFEKIKYAYKTMLFDK